MLKLDCQVICVDINENQLKLLESDLQTRFLNSKAHFYQADISCVTEVKKLASRVKLEVGKVDILVNNAGIMKKAKLFLDLNEDDILHIFNVNILSQMWLCKEFLPDMCKDNKGHIVNISSSLGMFGAFKVVDYCATKFAVAGFSEALRLELKVSNPDNKVKVSLVCPFHVKTSLFNGFEISRLKWYI